LGEGAWALRFALELGTAALGVSHLEALKVREVGEIWRLDIFLDIFLDPERGNL
jgi:hypothetical protein